MANAGLQYITGGRAWGILDRDHQEPGHEALRKLSAYGYQSDDAAQRYQDLRFDGKLTFNKVTDVYHAAVAHDEDQPAHLHVLDTNICATRCPEEYGNPCQRVCPAAVYEMHDKSNGRPELQINFPNCFQSKPFHTLDPSTLTYSPTP